MSGTSPTREYPERRNSDANEAPPARRSSVTAGDASKMSDGGSSRARRSSITKFHVAAGRLSAIKPLAVTDHVVSFLPLFSRPNHRCCSGHWEAARSLLPHTFSHKTTTKRSRRPTPQPQPLLPTTRLGASKRTPSIGMRRSSSMPCTRSSRGVASSLPCYKATCMRWCALFLSRRPSHAVSISSPKPLSPQQPPHRTHIPLRFARPWI